MYRSGPFGSAFFTTMIPGTPFTGFASRRLIGMVHLRSDRPPHILRAHVTPLDVRIQERDREARRATYAAVRFQVAALDFAIQRRARAAQIRAGLLGAISGLVRGRSLNFIHSAERGPVWVARTQAETRLGP